MPNEPYMVERNGEPGWHEATDWEAQSTKQNFMWWRPRMLGGRTNHWGRISLRFGPHDFKPQSRDGLGFDWPITYEELAPWYDKTEELIGVYGRTKGLENTPDSSPGCLQHAAAAARLRAVLTKAREKLGIPVIPSHEAVLTKPINGRSACIYATVRPRLLDQGQLPVDHRAAAAGDGDRQPGHHHQRHGPRGDLDRAGKAKGVSYVDKETGEDHRSRRGW